MVAVREAFSQYDMLLNQPILVKPKRREDPEGYSATALGCTSEGFLRVRVSSLWCKHVCMRVWLCVCLCDLCMYVLCLHVCVGMFVDGHVCDPHKRCFSCIILSLSLCTTALSVGRWIREDHFRRGGTSSSRQWGVSMIVAVPRDCCRITEKQAHAYCPLSTHLLSVHALPRHTHTLPLSLFSLLLLSLSLSLPQHTYSHAGRPPSPIPFLLSFIFPIHSSNTHILSLSLSRKYTHNSNGSHHCRM
jgi:hypothetical protein